MDTETISEPAPSFACDLCDRTFPTSQGLSMHISRMHQPPPTSDPDRLFEMIGAATAALFPEGIDPKYVIPIADWQRATIKFLGSLK